MSGWFLWFGMCGWNRGGWVWSRGGGCGIGEGGVE